MIGHKAIGQNITKGEPFIPYFTKEIKIIFVGKEDGLLIVSPVVKVIHIVSFKVHFFLQIRKFYGKQGVWPFVMAASCECSI
jgi:hypothetical protein